MIFPLYTLYQFVSIHLLGVFLKYAGRSDVDPNPTSKSLVPTLLVLVL